MTQEDFFSNIIFSEILSKKSVGEYSDGIKEGLMLAREKGRSIEEFITFAENTDAGDELWAMFLKRQSIISPMGFKYDFADFVEEVLDESITF